LTNCDRSRGAGEPHSSYNGSMTGRPAARLHGDDLVQAILQSMDAGHNKIRGKTIVPAIYRVYLNPEDYAPLRDIVPFLAGEVRAALEQRLAKLNGAGRVLGAVISRIGLDRNKTTYVRIPEDWTVEIHPDSDGTLKPGEIEVVSELGAPQRTDYGEGSKTRRIFARGAAAEAGAQPAEPPGQPAPEAAGAAGEAPGETDSDPTVRQRGEDAGAATEPTRARALATIRFTDEAGPQVYEVVKRQIMIGRGGRSFWVDLKLQVPTDVGREHCRIRQEPEGFVIEDLSKFGTTVNGQAVGKDRPEALPRRARIGLAGVVELEWEEA